MALLLSAALAISSAAVPENPELARGERLFADYKYSEALKALADARAVRGLDRKSLLRILELIGVSAGQLRQTAAAKAAFRELLLLDPNHQLAAEYAPRVMTPFYEVRQSVLEGGGLQFKAGTPDTIPGTVEAVSVVVARDPLSMVSGVRFHLLTAREWKVIPAPLKDGVASIPVKAAEAKWWAELLGDSESVLATIGSEESPRVDSPPAVAAPVAATQVEAAPSPSGSPLRTVSYVLLGAAAVGGGVGAYLGVQSSEAFGQIKRANTDGAGRITGLTERRAYELDAQGKQNALVANVLFASAGALAVGGIALWFLGAPVAVSPTPVGLVVSGSLP